MKRLLPASLALLAAGCTVPPAEPAAEALPTELSGAAAEGRVDAAAYQALVSAAHPLAAAAGEEMLRAGGTAADAALATLVALTVVEPQSSGIGGGGFLVYHDAESRRTYALDGRETAPAAATPDMFMNDDGTPKPYRASQLGGMAVGVPGNIRLMAKAHARFGRLPWSRLFQPAIRLASEGWEMDERLNSMLASSKDRAGFTAWARAEYYSASGEPKPVGSRLTNPALANFLRDVAARGPDLFYEGASAARIASTVATSPVQPQAMTPADIARYQAKWREPVCGSYRGYKVCGMPPPSSGGTTVIATLQQLEPFDLGAMGKDSPQAWYLIGESMRLAFADREKYLGDGDFVSVPTAGLVDAGYSASRARLIDPEKAIAKVEAGTPPGATAMATPKAQPEHGTSHFVAVDSKGDVASLTSTIESAFGSGLTVHGFFLNNEMTDFNFRPTIDGRPTANAVAAGKRPRSSMAPTIVYAPSGEVAFAVGAAGGPTIIAQVAKAIIGVIDWNLTIDDAIALPLLYAPGDVYVESDTPLSAMQSEFEAKGQTVRAAPIGGKGNGLQRAEGGKWIGGADRRGAVDGTVTGIR